MAFGDVRVTNHVASYVKKLVSTNEIVDEVPLPLPPVTLETKAVWWTLPPALLERAAVGLASFRARSMRRNTAPSDSSLSWRRATAGTSAACRRHSTRTPA